MRLFQLGARKLVFASPAQNGGVFTLRTRYVTVCVRFDSLYDPIRRHFETPLSLAESKKQSISPELTGNVSIHGLVLCIQESRLCTRAFVHISA